MAIRHKNFQATEYVIVFKNGKAIRQGLGLSLFYNNATTSLKVIPSTAFDTSYMFDDVTTKDFQKLSVQGDITYAISDFELASSMIDFSYIDLGDYKIKLTDARSKMAKRLNGIVQAEIARFMSEKDIRSAIQSQNELTLSLNEALKDNAYIKEFGLNVINVSVLSILPQPETRKALEASTREEILKEQDDAVYKRRNFAIEQERIIKENELNTEISIVEKEREKDEKAVEARMSLQEKNSKASMQKLEADNVFRMAQINGNLESDKAEHERNLKLHQFEQEEQNVINTTERAMAETKAYANEVMLKTFEKMDKDVLVTLLMSGMDGKTMIAKAFTDIASNSEKIGNLNISPDLLESLINR